MKCSKTPSFARRSLSADQTFRPEKVPRFSVIRVGLGEAGERTSKLLVCIGHQAGFAICLKATSKVDSYVNNPRKMQGAVFVEAGTLDCFPVNTVVQPDNQFPLNHANMATQYLTGDLRIEDMMPDSFQASLAEAVENSVTMSPDKKARFNKLHAL